MSDPRQLRLRVDSDPAKVRDVRRAVEALGRSAGFDEQSCGEIGLCVNEAIANVIRHAYAGASGRPIEIEARCDGPQMNIRVRDWGEPIDPARLPSDGGDPHSPGGVGLLCLRRLMDDVRFLPQRDGTLLIMTRHRGPRTSGAAR